MKKCSHCQKILSLDQFQKNRSRPDGLQSDCKICRKKLDAHYFRLPESKKRRYSLAKERRRKNPKRHWAYSSKKHHITSGFRVCVSSDFLYKLAQDTQYCSLCKKLLNWEFGKGHARHNSPTLDRINNEQILTETNVWIICGQCNRTKGERTLREFIDYCKMIYEESKYI